MHVRLELRDFKRIVTRCRPGAGNASAADRHQIAWLEARDGTLTLRTHDGTLTAIATAALLEDAPTVDGTAQVAFSDLAAAAKNTGVRNVVMLETADGNLHFTLTSPDGDQLDSGTYELTDERAPDALYRQVDGVQVPFDIDAAKEVLSAVGDGKDGLPEGMFVDQHGYYCSFERCVLLVDRRGASAGDTFAVPKQAAKAAQRAKGPATMTVGDGHVQLDCKEASYVAPALPATSLRVEHVDNLGGEVVDGGWDELAGIVRDWAKARRGGIPSLVVLRPDGSVELRDEEVPEQAHSTVMPDEPIVAYLPYLDKFLDGIRDDATVMVNRAARHLKLDQADGQQMRICGLGFLHEDG